MGSNTGGAGDLEGVIGRNGLLVQSPGVSQPAKRKQLEQKLKQEVSEATEEDFQTSSQWKLSGWSGGKALVTCCVTGCCWLQVDIVWWWKEYLGIRFSSVSVDTFNKGGAEVGGVSRLSLLGKVWPSALDRGVSSLVKASGGTWRFWSWNRGPALYSVEDIQACWGMTCAFVL